VIGGAFESALHDNADYHVSTGAYGFHVNDPVEGQRRCSTGVGTYLFRIIAQFGQILLLLSAR
jgi:hypothetical protein